jgi:hypothetical protein
MKKVCLSLAAAVFVLFSAAVPSAAADDLEALNRQFTELLLKASQSGDPCPYLPQLKDLAGRISKESPEVVGSFATAMNALVQAADCSSAEKKGAEPSPRRPVESRPLRAPSTSVPKSAGPTLDRTTNLDVYTRSILPLSITHVPIPPELVVELFRTLQSLGHMYVEYHKESVLSYTNKKDTAKADARGYKYRESPDFIVFYHEGDMKRAEATLTFAEGAKPRLIELFHHFPTAESHKGEKLEIYLTSTHDEFKEISKCEEWGIACVKHDFFPDGAKQTMYVSPRSLQNGVDDYRKTVTHELTHYTQFDLLDPNAIDGRKLWFVEGLAGYAAGETSRFAYIQTAVRDGKLVPLSELARLDEYPEETQSLNLFYAEGLSLLSMMERNNGKDAVSRFVLGLSSAKSLDEVSNLVLNENFAQLTPSGQLFSATGMPLNGGEERLRVLDQGSGADGGVRPRLTLSKPLRRGGGSATWLSPNNHQL